MTVVPVRSSAGQHLVLYDGVCGLCNRLNQFVLPRDPACFQTSWWTEATT